MKKTFQITSVTVFIVLTMAIAGQSQNSTSIAKLNFYENPENRFLPKEKTPAGFMEIKELRTNEINIRAKRDFISKFEDVSDDRWCISGNGLLAVHFTTEGITTRRYYNKKGICEYMIRYYSEEKLPRDVRHLIKSHYYDFDIFQVTEVNRNGKISYLAKIHDKDSWKTIKVVDKEMEVADEYLKK
jgi:hypothetical protein